MFFEKVEKLKWNPTFYVAHDGYLIMNKNTIKITDKNIQADFEINS